MLLAAGGLAVATGLLPWTDARATGERILPLLIFLGAVIVLAELAAPAEVFDVIAIRVTILARGRNVGTVRPLPGLRRAAPPSS